MFFHLKQDQHSSNTDKIDIDYQVESLPQCHQCGTDASPAWKKRKNDENDEEIICTLCNDKILQIEIRKEIEEKMLSTKLQYDEQVFILYVSHFHYVK